ncbi:MAG TPA: DUF6799 domain-containing protein [Saprospiraceae bacterium]|nr:DUF6799 domain-containing protein [Saprospiraceae bacterium]
MKNLILLITAIFFTSISLIGQVDKENNINTSNKNYCATLQDGLLVVKNEGKDLKSDMPLNNGTVIKLDGTVVKSDGTQYSLKLGECVDNTGNLVKSNEVPKLNEEKTQIQPKEKRK